MTTLLVGYLGHSARRCTAKCYDATAPGCHCICGGWLHGKGLERAQETLGMAQKMTELFGGENVIVCRGALRGRFCSDACRAQEWRERHQPTCPHCHKHLEIAVTPASVGTAEVASEAGGRA